MQRLLGVVGVALLILTACSTEASENEASGASNSALEGAKCGRRREGPIDIFVHCGEGSRCESASGEWILELPAEGTCVKLPPAAEGEFCGANDAPSCGEGLLCDYARHAGLNPGGRCIPKPAPGTNGGCCMLSVGRVIRPCAHVGFDCRPRPDSDRTTSAVANAFCNGVCIAP